MATQEILPADPAPVPDHPEYTPEVMEALIELHMSGDALSAEEQTRLYTAMRYIQTQPGWIRNCDLKVVGNEIHLVDPKTGQRLLDSDGQHLTSFHVLVQIDNWGSSIPPDYNDLDNIKRRKEGKEVFADPYENVNMKLAVPPRPDDVANLTDNANLHTKLTNVFRTLHKRRFGDSTEEQMLAAMVAGDKAANPVPPTNKSNCVELTRKVAWANPNQRDMRAVLEAAKEKGKPIDTDQLHQELLRGLEERGEDYLLAKMAKDPDFWRLKLWSQTRETLTYWGFPGQAVSTEDWCKIRDSSGLFYAFVHVSVTTPKRDLVRTGGTVSARLDFLSMELLGKPGQPMIAPRRVRGALTGQAGDTLLRPDVLAFARSRGLNVGGAAGMLKIRPPTLRRVRQVAKTLPPPEPEESYDDDAIEAAVAKAEAEAQPAAKKAKTASLTEATQSGDTEPEEEDDDEEEEEEEEEDDE